MDPKIQNYAELLQPRTSVKVKLIGSMQVFFKIEDGSDGWFGGTVASYQPETGFTIKYDDGQVDTGYFTNKSFHCGTEVSPFRRVITGPVS